MTILSDERFTTKDGTKIRLLAVDGLNIPYDKSKVRYKKEFTFLRTGNQFTIIDKK